MANFCSDEGVWIRERWEEVIDMRIVDTGATDVQGSQSRLRGLYFGCNRDMIMYAL